MYSVCLFGMCERPQSLHERTDLQECVDCGHQWWHLRSTRCLHDSPLQSPNCRRCCLLSKRMLIVFSRNYFLAYFQSSRTMKLTQPIKRPFQLSGPSRTMNRKVISMTAMIHWRHGRGSIGPFQLSGHAALSTILSYINKNFSSVRIKSTWRILSSSHTLL